MIVDFREAAAPNCYRARICVIGSGPVGLSFASAFFRGDAHDIIIVESGASEASSESDALNEVINVGKEASGNSGSRARVFGGTSTLWGGQAIPLSPIDFEGRTWVENSGWPLSIAELKGHFRDASRILRIDDRPFDEDIWTKGSGFKRDFDREKIELTFSKWSPTPNFAKKYLKDLKTSRHATLLLGATVTQLELDGCGGVVSNVSIKNPGGKAGQVDADFYVLCCGGIENARILLGSSGVISAGIGNQYGNVGCFFQDHAAYYAAKLIPRNFRKFVDLFSSYFSADQMYLPKLQLSKQQQRLHRSLNVIGNAGVEYNEKSALALKRLFNDIKTRSITGETVRNAVRTLRNPAESFRLLFSYAISRRMYYSRSADYFLIANCETAPTRESRVSLTSERDVLGFPKVQVNWVNTAAAKHTLRIYAERVRDELARLDIADAVICPSLLDEGDDWRRKLFSIYHHIGTTRMSDSDRLGVVDRNCKVHGVSNLFIGGSSVFPTSGAANPTFTAIALVLRLADRVKCML